MMIYFYKGFDYLFYFVDIFGYVDFCVEVIRLYVSCGGVLFFIDVS